MCLIQRADDTNILKKAVEIALNSTQEPTRQIRRGNIELQVLLKKLKDARRNKRKKHRYLI